MAGKRLDIRDVLHLTRAGTGAADATRKRDDQTAMAALIGADLQQFRRGDAVESCPVGKRVRVMHLAGDGSHQGDRIGFAMGQGPDGLHDVLHLRPPACDR